MNKQLPYYSLFDAFRQNQEFELGMSDYFDLLKVLQADFVWNKTTSEVDKTIFLQVCQSLWLKPNQSLRLFREIFEQEWFQVKKDWENEQKNKEEKAENKENQKPDNEPINQKNDDNKPQQNLDEKSQNEKQPTSEIPKTQSQNDNSNELIKIEVSVGNPEGNNKGGIPDKKENLEERIFLFSDDYLPINERQVQQIWRILPEKIKSKKTQVVDIERTTQLIAQRGYFAEAKFVKQKKAVNKVFWLSDHQGSMIAFENLDNLFVTQLQAAFKDYNQQDTQISRYYFHNVPQDYLYKNMAHTKFVAIEDFVKNNKSRQSLIVIFSDAGAARNTNSSLRVRATIRAIFQLKALNNKIVWLNPMPRSRWKNTSAERIARFVDMFEANEKGIIEATHFLKGKLLQKSEII